jgi:hypothetical protein
LRLLTVGYAIVIGLGVMALGVPVARAGAEHAMQATGLSLLDQFGPELVGPPQAVNLNGERMWLASSVTPLGVSDVLDEFGQNCQRWLASRSIDPHGVGQLACLASPDDREPASLFRRARDFAQSGDLSRLGDARYIVARPDAATGNTHVLSVWTQGHFDLPAMFPTSGDVPGGDPEEVPRPQDSVRILSARVVGRSYALHVYATSRSSAEVLEFYVQELKHRGFSLQAEHATNARTFIKEGRAVFVVTSVAAGGRVGVSLLEMARPGHVEARAQEAP